MALSTYKNTLVAPTATGTQTITGVPFQPKAVLFWSTSLVSGAAATNVYLSSFGGATRDGGVTQQFGIGNGENGGASSNAGRAATSGVCIILPLNGNFGTDGYAGLTAFTSDGFTLNWGDAPASANMLVHYLALGGADLTNARCGTHTIVRTTAGTEATAGLGFQPDCLLFASPGVPSSTSIVDAILALGAARRTPTVTRWAQLFFENDGANTMDTGQYVRTDKCLALPDATSVLEAEADISTFDAGGFTLNWTNPVAAASSRVFYYLALKGGQYELGQATSPISTGNNAVTTAFQPTGLLLSWLSRRAVTAFTTSAGDAGYGVGASDGTRTGFAAVNETDGNADSQSWRHHDSSHAVYIPKGIRTAKAARSSATFSSWAATNFTLNWDAVDASAYEYQYVVFGDAVASGNIFTKTGSVVTATASAGGDVFTASETGVVKSGAVSVGADVFEATEVGSVLTTSKAAGTGNRTFERAGAATTTTLGLGADVFTAVETASVITGTVLAGGDAVTLSRVGSVSTGATTAGADVFEASETGTVSTFAFASGAGFMGAHSKIGSVTTRVLAAGVETSTFTESGVVIVASIMVGSRTVTFTEAGSATSRATSAGTDVGTFSETGSVTSGATSDGSRLTEKQRLGALIAGTKTAGADVFQATETGAIFTAALVGASDAYHADRAGAVVTRALLAGASELIGGIVSLLPFDQPSPSGGVDRGAPQGGTGGGTPAAAMFDSGTPSQVRT
jgi:hypothetical protein